MKKILILFILSIIFFDLSIIVVKGETTNKIVFETTNDYKQLSLNEEIVDENAIDEIVVQIKFKTEKELEELNQNISRDDEKYRARAKKYFYSANEKNFKSISLSNYKSYYISKYSPYIEFTFDKDKFYQYQDVIINQLNSNDDIEIVYVKEYCYQKPEQLILSLACAYSSTIYRQRTYTGEGVTVGILEPGVVNISYEEFKHTKCKILAQVGFTQYVTEHATQMAALILADDGIAPDATLLSAYLYGSPNEEIEWMIENDVDIINMSYGEANPTGVYDSDSAYMDYIVRAYGVIIVASTGNNGGVVSNPALGYNVIGVGSADEFLVRHSFSAYTEVNGPEKPTVVTHGYCVNVPLGDHLQTTGTSNSAAIATGIIALLMERYPSLKGYPEKLLALLTSSAQYSSVYNHMNQSNGFDNQVGAGMINWLNFEAHYSSAKSIIQVTGTSGNSIYRYNVSLTKGEIIKASIAWTAYTTGTVDSLKMTNYDLKIADSDGNIVAESVSTSSNIEHILFEVPETGTYSLRIYLNGTIKKLNEEIVLSYGPASDNAEIYGFK